MIGFWVLGFGFCRVLNVDEQTKEFRCSRTNKHKERMDKVDETKQNLAKGMTKALMKNFGPFFRIGGGQRNMNPTSQIPKEFSHASNQASKHASKLASKDVQHIQHGTLQQKCP